ncbi:MAG: Na+/H+ antiporter [Candidatus Promineifilaceae bacterium]|nr:Na+/H+ antiporter [Candidatus Promineifilaceae bacterium]
MNLDFLLSWAAQESSLLQTELGFVLILSVAAVVAILARRVRLPYTVMLVIAGLILSFFPNPFGIELTGELILALLVPPLIFEATLNLRWENLRRDLPAILLLAAVGTLLGTFVVTGLVQLAGDTFIPKLNIPISAAIAFGALISATDPVAVISLFRSLGVPKRLGILVEGESLFNDGIAIVIFNIALAAGAMANGEGGEAFTLTGGILDFLQVSFGGLGVGIILGYLVSSLILRNVDDHLIETATTVALAFGSFIVAEEFHVSGVLAVVAAGLFVGNIGMQNTSPTTKITLENFWEFMAFVVNSLVFLLIGLEAELRQFPVNILAILWAVAAVLLSRVLVVYGLGRLHNLLNARRRISLSYRHVMYWGGLRGAISLALALSLGEAGFEQAVVLELQLMTFGVVLFTLLVQGTTIAPLLKRLGMAEQPPHQRDRQRRQALLYAIRAGKRELDRLYQDGILSVEVWEAMAEVYDRQARRRNRELQELIHEFPELEQQMILQARRDLLNAERAAISDANRRGLIADDVYHRLIQETDSQMAALDYIHSSAAVTVGASDEVEG